MAIDYVPHPDAHDLAHLEKGFYSAKIPVSHWQLRNYISNPEPDLLYYASGQDIYCLNTVTKKRKHIATLPFEARCTASGYGWICVGGDEDGHFAAIKLDGSPQAQQRDVDMALPIDDHWRPGAHTRRATSVKVERMGEEIVNSISIHRIQDEEAHLDDIVAVLTNNDKTVRIYSLPAGLETRVKDLPFAMNHATISPDGQTLVAVGDYNQAYFFKREIVDTPPQIPKPHNRLTSASVEWNLTNVVTLFVSNPEGSIGFFTTAWSPNGRLVAVGSEAGYIAVFDLDILMSQEHSDEDAVVATVPGSRSDLPSPHPGAIRSMLFSPEPWNLLIWAEDQGRICVGDLRTALKKRQIVHLDPKDEALVELRYEDVPADDITPMAESESLHDLEADLLRRYRSAPDNTSAVSSAAEYLEARRRYWRRAREPSSQQANTGQALEDDPQGLTATEQQVLETLRTARQREEARSGGQPTNSGNNTVRDLFNAAWGRSAAASLSLVESSIANDILSSVQDSLPELSRTHATNPRPSSSHARDSPNPLSPLNGVQDGTRGSGLTRQLDTSRLPRRRASVVLNPLPSQTDSTANNNAAPGQPSTLSTTGELRALDHRRLVEQQMEQMEQIAVAHRQLQDSSNRVQASPPPPSSTIAADRRQLQAEVQNELDTQQRIRLAQQMQRQRERYRTVRAATAATASNPAGGPPSITSSTATSNGGGTTTSTATERPPTVLLEARLPPPLPDGYEMLLRRSQMRALSGRSGREIGVRTAGLAMSSDGGTLWAACEEGIFEVKLRLSSRMFWPALEWR